MRLNFQDRALNLTIKRLQSGNFEITISGISPQEITLQLSRTETKMVKSVLEVMLK